MFKNLDKLLSGQVGKIVTSTNFGTGDGDYESEFWNDETCEVNYNEKKYELQECVGDIDEFFEQHEIDSQNLILFREDGLEEVQCYFGLYFTNDQVYHLDILNDYEVWLLTEIVE